MIFFVTNICPTKRLVFTLLLIVIFLKINAQNNREIVDEQQVWTGYFSQIRLTKKLGIWADIHFRATDQFVKSPSKLLTRVGLMYYLNEHLKLTNGYAFINHFPEEGHANISQPEHRIWQQLQNHSKHGNIRSMQWVRLEERFRRKIKNVDELGEGYRFDLRLRSNLMFNFPLSRKGIAPKTVSAILNDEFFINFKNSSNPNYFLFDQNRFFVGLSYNFSNHSNLQFGYMNVFQQLTKGSKFKNIDALRLFYFQNLDFRNK